MAVEWNVEMTKSQVAGTDWKNIRRYGQEKIGIQVKDVGVGGEPEFARLVRFRSVPGSRSALWRVAAAIGAGPPCRVANTSL